MRLVESSDARLALINSLARSRNQKLANAAGALRKAQRKNKAVRRQSPQLDPDSVDYSRPQAGWRAFMKDHVFWSEERTVGYSDNWLSRRQVLGIRDSSPTPSLTDDLSECSSCCDSDSPPDLTLMTPPPLLLLPEPEPEPVLVKEEEDKLFDMYINMDLCAP